MKHVVIIKRYANRKLYSTATSAYVTIADVLELSRTKDILVIDNKTKNDITKYVLAMGEAKLAFGGETPVEPTPLFAPGILGDILDAITSNAERDRKQTITFEDTAHLFKSEDDEV